MVHNVGKADQIIRLSIALLAVVLYYLNISGGDYNTYFLVAASLMLITSVRKCCPIYALLGFGTCRVETGDGKPVVKTKKINLK